MQKEYIAWWGACLSTLLAIVKLWELWRDRFRVNIGHNFSAPETGNEIFVRNLSSKPIIMESWGLYHASGAWLFRKFIEFDSPGPDTVEITIAPHSSKTFTFTEASYFSWGENQLKGRKIYMRLYIAGRRPFYKKVYG